MHLIPHELDLLVIHLEQQKASKQVEHSATRAHLPDLHVIRMRVPKQYCCKPSSRGQHAEGIAMRRMKYVQLTSDDLGIENTCSVRSLFQASLHDVANSSAPQEFISAAC